MLERRREAARARAGGGGAAAGGGGGDRSAGFRRKQSRIPRGPLALEFHKFYQRTLDTGGRNAAHFLVQKHEVLEVVGVEGAEACSTYDADGEHVVHGGVYDSSAYTFLSERRAAAATHGRRRGGRRRLSGAAAPRRDGAARGAAVAAGAAVVRPRGVRYRLSIAPLEGEENATMRVRLRLETTLRRDVVSEPCTQPRRSTISAPSQSGARASPSPRPRRPRPGRAACRPPPPAEATAAAAPPAEEEEAAAAARRVPAPPERAAPVEPEAASPGRRGPRRRRSEPRARACVEVERQRERQLGASRASVAARAAAGRAAHARRLAPGPRCGRQAAGGPLGTHSRAAPPTAGTPRRRTMATRHTSHVAIQRAACIRPTRRRP